VPYLDEWQARRHLGIPDDAERVMIFAESSHWDPDWLLTSEEYYSFRIRSILDKAVRLLLEDPCRVFSVESIFFFKMYWDRNPGKRDAVRHLANDGRIRFSGTGFTQPDTMIPSTEAIIRDYLIGQQWLADNGIAAEPRIAYMTDDFGLSPAFPSILRALGIDYAAGSRIDGHYFPGTDYALPGRYPLPGSSAELLLERLGTTEVVWRAPDGARVIYHLNLRTYDLGGTIAMLGPARWMDIPIGVPFRSERHVANRIDSYHRALSPYTKTPYVFCPIGGDFVSPINGLPGLLERYNGARRTAGDVFTVLASLEDYMDLVSFHRESLPVVDLDPNPNFMGFYFSRPDIKRGCRRISEDLLQAEKCSFVVEAGGGAIENIDDKIASAWEMAAVTNHHDFITGTSPGRVYKKEQAPWVRKADGLAQEALCASATAASSYVETALETHASPPDWNLADGVLKVESDHYELELSEEHGGCITGLLDTASGCQLLAGYGNDLVIYGDSGGLWRMGSEFKGGRFERIARASASPSTIEARESEGVLEVAVESLVGRTPVRRLIWLAAGSPLIWMRTVASLPEWRTLTCSFETRLQPRNISMDVTGGVVERPLEKTYKPTFWSAQSFAHITGEAAGCGLALFSAQPATVNAEPSGLFQWVVARNARFERAFGFIPVISFPASGPDPSAQTFDCAVCVTGPGSWRDNRLHDLAHEGINPSWRNDGRPDTAVIADRAITSDNTDIKVLAVKRASRGEGWIVRLFAYGHLPATTRIETGIGRISRAVLCDARERDLESLDVEDGRAVIPLTGTITTVRVTL